VKPKLKTILEEADKDQLFEILVLLCEKYKYLSEDIEFILSPREIKNPQSYYNKLVKKAIDTNSWSKFPNKGVKGLQEMIDKVFFLEKIGNIFEAQKLAKSILETISRTKKNYNSQNVEDIQALKIKLHRYWE
jgi:hypothetical protein